MNGGVKLSLRTVIYRYHDFTPMIGQSSHRSVLSEGVEPSCLATYAFEAYVSTIPPR